MAWGMRGNGSTSSLDRMGASSQPRLWVLKKRLAVLILFAVVLGGLLLSSMMLVVNHDRSSLFLRPDKPLALKLQARNKRAAADAAATSSSVSQGTGTKQPAASAAGSRQQGAQSTDSGVSGPEQPAAATSLTSASRRQRWRWKQPPKEHPQQGLTQTQPHQQQSVPSNAAASSRAGGSKEDARSVGVALPTILVEQLQQQQPPEVSAAASLNTASELDSTPAGAPAAAAAGPAPATAKPATPAPAPKPVAAPEDISLILASRQGEERQGSAATAASAASDASVADLPDGVDPADATSAYIRARGLAPTRVKHPLWWHGPMWSGSGYGSEAVNYVLSLLRTGRLAPADIWAYHHGDGWREHVVKSMSTEDRVELEYLQSLPVKYRHKRSAVVVCHSVPTNWAFPEPMWVAGAPCPPNPKEFAWVYSVGRTMFETDRLPAVFVPRLNAMNEIWVPSEWQRQSFIQSGVDASKLVVVPEGVNTSLFNPALYTPLPLRDKAQLVFGRRWEVKMEHEAASSAAAAAVPDTAPAFAAGGSASTLDVAESSAQNGTDQANSSSSSSNINGEAGSAGKRGSQREAREGDSALNSSNSSNSTRQPFRFISTFKWEARKGWDILLEAYLTAFTADDDVELYILTQPFGKSGSSFKEKMSSWADKLNITQHGSSYSSSTSSRSLLGRQQAYWVSEQQQSAFDPDRLNSELSGQVSTVGTSNSRLGLGRLEAGPVDHDTQQLWAAHVDDVVQQVQDFAGQLQQRLQLQYVNQAATTGDKGESDRVTKRQLLVQPSSARASGITITTAPPATAASSAGSAQKAAASAGKAAEAAAARYPTLYIVTGHISDADFPRFYKAGDAFVLPSRGEGWGRPHVEAMSMGLPVISTNWSGITAYLDESVGYPITVDRLVPVSGGDEVVWWFRGLKWAQPSVQHLAALMRRVYFNRAEAAAKGAAARARMVEKYSPEAIADVLVKELQRVQEKVP